jgi:phosphonate transport system substrate-binding protein
MVALENDGDYQKRYQPLEAYLRRVLERPVEIRHAADYAGIIEALRAGTADLVYFGAAAYARAWKASGGKVRPLACTLNEEGQPGYYSVIEVSAASPYQRVEDLKDKKIAFADPNSTSGFMAPCYYLRKQGIDADRFFSKMIFAGTHEGAVLSLIQGVTDAAATWAYGPTRTNAARMAEKNLIPKGSTRMIWRSPIFASSAWVVRADTPQQEQDRWQHAITSFAKADPAGFAIVGRGRETGYAPASHEYYLPVIEMVESNLQRRKEAQ